MLPIVRRILYGALLGALVGAIFMPRPPAPGVVAGFAVAGVMLAVAGLVVSEWVSSISHVDRSRHKD